MLEVRENEIALPKLSGGAARLRTSEGTLCTIVLFYAYQVRDPVLILKATAAVLLNKGLVVVRPNNGRQMFKFKPYICF